LPSFKIVLSGLVTGFFLYIPIKLLDQLVFDTTRSINLLILTGISTTLGMSVYLFLAWFLDVPQVSIIAKLFGRITKPRKNLDIDTTQEVVNAQGTEI